MKDSTFIDLVEEFGHKKAIELWLDSEDRSGWIELSDTETGKNIKKDKKKLRSKINDKKMQQARQGLEYIKEQGMKSDAKSFEQILTNLGTGITDGWYCFKHTEDGSIIYDFWTRVEAKNEA